jgi:spherulation-specific family 4 protein
MRIVVLGITTFLIVSAVVISLISKDNHSIDSMKLAIPAYFPPGPLWTQALSGFQAVGLLIMNPQNGPGSSIASEYVSLLQEAHSKGLHVLGYVPTAWANGTIPEAQAEDWIVRYYQWYNVDGIFLDETNDSCVKVNLDYYTGLYQFIKAQHGTGLVALNPGKPTGECYFSISDVIVTFEGNYNDYLQLWAYSTSSPNHPHSQVWHIIYNVPNAYAMDYTLGLARQRGAGWVYITDKGAGSGLTMLPTYFQQEVAALSR